MINMKLFKDTNCIDILILIVYTFGSHLNYVTCHQRLPNGPHVVDDDIETNKFLFPSKYSPSLPPPPPKSIRKDLVEYAHVRTTKGDHRVWGAKATIQVANPRVSGEKEHSMAHVLLVSDYGTVTQKSIEAGWIRTLSNFGKIKMPTTSFYIRWTDDRHRKTGCINLGCDGFIQTNSSIKLGEYVPPDVPLKIEIHHDPWNTSWHLFKDGHEVGYWPNSIFTNLENGFEQAIFGGEVGYEETSMHTGTKMGTGRFGTEGEGRAAGISKIKILTVLNNRSFQKRFHNLRGHEIQMNKPKCYNATVQNPHPVSGGFTVYYGGPGFDEEHCP